MKKAKFAIVFEQNAIIFPLLNPAVVCNALLRNFAFYQLKQCHIPQGLYQLLQNLHFPSLTPLTTKHCDRNMLTFAQIIDFIYMFGSLLPSNVDE
jgi:hypothetical protein